MTSPETIAVLQDALWAPAEEFGVRLAAGEQVAIARALGDKPASELTPGDVQDVFAKVGLSRPPVKYAKAVLGRVQMLHRRPGLLDVLRRFRHDAIRNLSTEFGGRNQGREDELRDHLLMYLPERGYAEAKTGRGRTDILLPAPPRVIEVKIWGGLASYEAGMEELGRYILTESMVEAYMVVFADREPLPPIVRDHHQEIAETRTLEGLRVPVVVIPFEVDQPSKAAAKARRRVDE